MARDGLAGSTLCFKRLATTERAAALLGHDCGPLSIRRMCSICDKPDFCEGKIIFGEQCFQGLGFRGRIVLAGYRSYVG